MWMYFDRIYILSAFNICFHKLLFAPVTSVCMYIYIYTVSQKTVQICFCQNFVKFPPILIIFLQNGGKEAKIVQDALIFHLI